MPGQPPPSRYRIYERHRRLVVVDQWAHGARSVHSPVTFAGSSPTKQTRVGKLDRIAFDGRTAFTTHPLFDAKGPRTIILDAGSASTIKGIKIALVAGAAAIVTLGFVAPFLLLPLVILFQRKMRDLLRSAATAWLDRIATITS
ncbi:MAG: hypothetical protein K2X59_11690 [Sphingomonas sp.]|nr:hypothetical protein [Sphingomonas sp.]